MIKQLLTELVSIKSNYPFEKDIALYLRNLFEKNKFTVKKQQVEQDRQNLIIEKGLGSKSIVLYSHLDTVDVVDGWKTNPFQLSIKKNKAYGLGAWDMKGGMVVNILSFLDYHPKNFKLKLVFCVDEENISKGGYKLINSNIINKNDCVISTEPAFSHGINGVVTGRIGRAVYQIQIIGQSKHFFYYQKKFDVNLFASHFLNEISRLDLIINENKKQSIFARKIESSAVGMSLPEKTIIELDSAVLPPNTHELILKEIQNIGQKLNSKFNNYFKININLIKRETPFLESYEIKKTDLSFKKMCQSVQMVTGKKAIPYFRSSVADENIFGAHGMTVLGIGPEGGNAHSANEWVDLNSLENLYNILISFLKNYDLG